MRNVFFNFGKKKSHAIAFAYCAAIFVFFAVFSELFFSCASTRHAKSVDFLPQKNEAEENEKIEDEKNAVAKIDQNRDALQNKNSKIDTPVQSENSFQDENFSKCESAKTNSAQNDDLAQKQSDFENHEKNDNALQKNALKNEGGEILENADLKKQRHFLWQISRALCASAKKNAASLCNFFLARNPVADKERASRMAAYYIEECRAEGINSDVAFVQMCLETDFLRFGNLVNEEMNNFCGLGAIDENHRGEVFASEREGVRAHIQHLHAYATSESVPLKNALVDARYRYVNPRGKAPTVFELAGTWAADKEYGEKLDRLLSELEKF